MSVIDVSKVTSKGQITIPKAVRDRLKLEAGDRVIFYETGDERKPEIAIVKQAGKKP